MLLSAMCNVSFASEGSEYAILFTVQGSLSEGTIIPEEELQGSALPETGLDEKPAAFADGETYTLDEINRISEASDVTQTVETSPALFSNATLFVNFFDLRAEFSKNFPLNSCESVDIQHGEDLSQQRVICDGVSYVYNVKGSAIEILMDDEVALEIGLEDEHFTLNGKLYPAVQ